MSIEARPELLLIAHRRIVTHYRHFQTDEYKGLGNIITPASPSITPDTLLRIDSTYSPAGHTPPDHQVHIDHSIWYERRRTFRFHKRLFFCFLLLPRQQPSSSIPLGTRRRPEYPTNKHPCLGKQVSYPGTCRPTAFFALSSTYIYTKYCAGTIRLGRIAATRERTGR